MSFARCPGLGCPFQGHGGPIERGLPRLFVEGEVRGHDRLLRAIYHYLGPDTPIVLVDEGLDPRADNWLILRFGHGAGYLSE